MAAQLYDATPLWAATHLPESARVKRLRTAGRTLRLDARVATVAHHWLLRLITWLRGDVVSFCDRPNCCLCSIMHGDLAQNRFQMNFDRRFGYIT